MLSSSDIPATDFPITISRKELRENFSHLGEHNSDYYEYVRERGQEI